MAISDMGIAQIREGLASKQFTACEVAQASLDRIAQADSQVHAFLEVTSEAAMAAAQRVDQTIADGTFDALGPLAGVPVAFKDNMNMTGTHTTCSSRMLENYVSPYTATCVQRIIDAGGVPLGKLNMDEFAFGSTLSPPRSAPRATRGIWVVFRAAARAALRRRSLRAWHASRWAPTRAAPSASLPASAASWASSPPTARSAVTASWPSAVRSTR